MYDGNPTQPGDLQRLPRGTVLNAEGGNQEGEGTTHWAEGMMHGGTSKGSMELSDSFTGERQEQVWRREWKLKLTWSLCQMVEFVNYPSCISGY